MRTVIANEIINARFGQFGRGLERRPAEFQGPDETVEVLQNADGTWSIKSPDGSEWLSVQVDGSLEGRPVSDPSQPAAWERFTRKGNLLMEQKKDGVDRPLVELIVRDL